MQINKTLSQLGSFGISDVPMSTPIIYTNADFKVKLTELSTEAGMRHGDLELNKFKLTWADEHIKLPKVITHGDRKAIALDTKGYGVIFTKVTNKIPGYNATGFGARIIEDLNICLNYHDALAKNNIIHRFDRKDLDEADDLLLSDNKKLRTWFKPITDKEQYLNETPQLFNALSYLGLVGEVHRVPKSKYGVEGKVTLAVLTATGIIYTLNEKSDAIKIELTPVAAMIF